MAHVVMVHVVMALCSYGTQIVIGSLIYGIRIKSGSLLHTRVQRAWLSTKRIFNKLPYPRYKPLLAPKHWWMDGRIVQWCWHASQP